MNQFLLRASTKLTAKIETSSAESGSSNGVVTRLRTNLLLDIFMESVPTVVAELRALADQLERAQVPGASAPAEQETA